MSHLNEEVAEVFCRAAHEVAGRQLSELKADDRISGLGVDSVALMEIIGIFEDEFGIYLPDESLEGIQTLGDFSNLVLAQRIAA